MCWKPTGSKRSPARWSNPLSARTPPGPPGRLARFRDPARVVEVSGSSCPVAPGILRSFPSPSFVIRPHQPAVLAGSCLARSLHQSARSFVSHRRLLKAAEAIREVVAQSILTELRDPRVQDVTVVGVKVSPDMREAKVAVSVMGDEKQQALSLRGLQNAAGFLQSKIAGRIETRYTPRLTFVLDKGQENAMIVGQLLAKIRREQQGEADNDMADNDQSEGEPPFGIADAPVNGEPPEDDRH